MRRVLESIRPTFLRWFVAQLALSGFCSGLVCAQAGPPAKPIRIKVVVVAAFERGEDTGDAPGEFQLWVEREHLDQVLPLPAGYRHVRLNKDGVLGMVTGVATAKAAASVSPCSVRVSVASCASAT